MDEKCAKFEPKLSLYFDLFITRGPEGPNSELGAILRDPEPFQTRAIWNGSGDFFLTLLSESFSFEPSARGGGMDGTDDRN